MTRPAFANDTRIPSSPSSAICTSSSSSSASSDRPWPLPEPARTGRWRLFVAAPLPDAAAELVWEVLAEVRAKHPQVRWLSPNKLHLTLVFLGSTDPQCVDAIAAAVSTVARNRRPFAASTGSAGGRMGGRRGGVAWLRLAAGARELAQLALDVDEAIGSHTFDARNAPRPHLTVARGVTESALADLRAAAPSIQLRWTVGWMVLFRSHTDPGGSRYEELGSAVLAA